jgi:hypothetical protein
MPNLHGATRRAFVHLLGETPLVYVDCGAREGRIPRPFRSLKHRLPVEVSKDVRRHAIRARDAFAACAGPVREVEELPASHDG